MNNTDMIKHLQNLMLSATYPDHPERKALAQAIDILQTKENAVDKAVEALKTLEKDSSYPNFYITLHSDYSGQIASFTFGGEEDVTYKEFENKKEFEYLMKEVLK